MFNITELDEVVYRQLNRHDLTQCIRVNKHWYSAIIPFIWHDLSAVHHENSREPFRRMVLDDYLDYQRRQIENNHGKDLQPPTQEQSSTFVSGLAKYGPWIRKLPDFKDLLQCFRPQPQQASSSQDSSPPVHELVRYFYSHCPSIQIPSFKISGGDFDSCALEVIAESVLPRIKELQLVQLDSWEIKYVLDRCPGPIRDLSIVDNPGEIPYNDNDSDIDEDQDDNDDWQDEGEQLAMNHRRRFWRVELQSCNKRSKKFWSWFWRQCGSSMCLEVGMLHKAVIRCLAQSIPNMPKMSKISLGRRRFLKHRLDMTDGDVAMLLSSSSRGWSSVTIRKTVQFNDKVMNALTKHFSTLRAMEIFTLTHPLGERLVQILSSCPHLTIFTVYDYDVNDYCREKHIGAEVFIDRDLQTGSLKTWACENSLSILRIYIPCFLGNQEETYDDHGREIQSLVYDRLSRLVNLESLWLGLCSGHQRRVHCLDMSLEGGLHKLEGLKELESLDVFNLRTRIGLEEVQWMVEHWPKLQSIEGFGTKANYEDYNNRKALEWLNAHHPEIGLI
ncbi:hypothetical protein B0O80DRAFT_499645 [Mortierella sp. GBAus27b]|nr:hypothetical protein BGX31_005096 [Mortierella sp. GBA43]KAI8352348.1 hypothetical protein B0O80DRAFT_499645 [Mortierella sp. GBAus27b]